MRFSKVILALCVLGVLFSPEQTCAQQENPAKINFELNLDELVPSRPYYGDLFEIDLEVRNQLDPSRDPKKLVIRLSDDPPDDLELEPVELEKEYSFYSCLTV